MATSVFNGLAQDATIRGNDRAASHRTRSAQRATADFTDAATFTEKWADLTQWSSNTAVTVSGGRMYGNSAGGGSGINHAFPVGTAEKMRMVASVFYTPDASGNGIIVGVSTDAAGAAATAGGGAAYGLRFINGNIYQWTTGANAATLVSGLTGNYLWTVTITVDTTSISAVAVRSDGGLEVLARWPLPAAAINNLFMFNSFASTTTGDYIGYVGARKGTATVSPRGGIEGVQRTVHYTNAADGSHLSRIALPRNYDSRVPSPLVIFAHGHGASETMPASDSNARAVSNALLDAGYIVASTVGNSTGTEFGSSNLQNSQAALYKYVRDHYNIGSVFCYGISMGGLGSLLSAVDPRIPGVRAWAGSSPICSLSYAYNQTAQGWPGEMNTEYGIASGTLGTGGPYAVGTTSLPSSVSFPVGSTPTIAGGTSAAETVTVMAVTGASAPYTLTVSPTAQAHAAGDTIAVSYSTATAGHDPLLLPAATYTGLPMLFIASPADTTVTKSANTDAMASYVANTAKSVTVIPAGGAHNDTSQYPASTIVAFFDQFA